MYDSIGSVYHFNPGATATSAPLEGRTAWIRNLQAPVREFLTTETGGAIVLLGATVAALLWANLDPSSYERVWSTKLSIRRGPAQVRRTSISPGSVIVIAVNVRHVPEPGPANGPDGPCRTGRPGEG